MVVGEAVRTGRRDSKGFLSTSGVSCPLLVSMLALALASALSLVAGRRDDGTQAVSGLATEEGSLPWEN